MGMQNEHRSARYNAFVMFKYIILPSAAGIFSCPIFAEKHKKDEP